MKIIDFKKASCKHCYKCVRSCSVKAIRVKNAQAEIMKEYCILCGKCLEVCPQNAKTFVSDLEQVKSYIRSGQKVDYILRKDEEEQQREQDNKREIMELYRDMDQYNRDTWIIIGKRLLGGQLHKYNEDSIIEKRLKE